MYILNSCLTLLANLAYRSSSTLSAIWCNDVSFATLCRADNVSHFVTHDPSSNWPMTHRYCLVCILVYCFTDSHATHNFKLNNSLPNDNNTLTCSYKAKTKIKKKCHESSLSHSTSLNELIFCPSRTTEIASTVSGCILIMGQWVPIC